MEDRVIRTVVGPESEGVRLDLFLAARFTYRSRTGWQETIRRGGIRLNGRRTRSSRPLHGGDVIVFEPDESELVEPPVDFAYSILLDTPDFLAVNKPGDLPVHPSGRYFRHTLLMHLQETSGRLFPVNRLDRETSGVVLLAKSSAAARALCSLFERDGLTKTYVAFVFGEFPAGTVDAAGWLASDPGSPVNKKRKFYRELPTPHPASAQFVRTEFRRLASGAGMSMVECRPHTGRLHQIRATLCSLGFPLVGDKLYGPDDSMYLRFLSDSLTESDRARLKTGRQALHAAALTFRSPFTGEEIFLKAPLPDGLRLLQDEISGV